MLSVILVDAIWTLPFFIHVSISYISSYIGNSIPTHDELELWVSPNFYIINMFFSLFFFQSICNLLRIFFFWGGLAAHGIKENCSAIQSEAMSHPGVLIWFDLTRSNPEGYTRTRQSSFSKHNSLLSLVLQRFHPRCDHKKRKKEVRRFCLKQRQQAGTRDSGEGKKPPGCMLVTCIGLGLPCLPTRKENKVWGDTSQSNRS